MRVDVGGFVRDVVGERSMRPQAEPGVWWKGEYEGGLLYGVSALLTFSFVSNFPCKFIETPRFEIIGVKSKPPP